MQLPASITNINLPKNALKAGFAIAAGYYFFSYATHPLEPHFIDAVNLVIHEAGHSVFAFFGTFIHIAGGTIMQLLVPALFVGYFWHRHDYYAAGMVLYWVGQNLMNISVYARDAMIMQLPLLGGDSVGHDWNNMLSMVNLLPQAEVFAQTILILGYITVALAFGISLWFSLGAEWQKKS